jgi:hypothetical protein
MNRGVVLPGSRFRVLVDEISQLGYDLNRPTQEGK